ncbi:MAG: NAD(P)/FAD-dependent oxidoreductase [Alphaproteobacteria bacterium]|nr:NAD(P)/FAD-dependent oxidoreductase [Alphaproteobacteria bacterium]
MSDRPAGSCRVLILGAGMSGICAGIHLRRRGIDDFLILEKADRIGGTWRDNRYPGIACDVPSHLYSFSFEPNPDWSRLYSPGAEIQAYFEHCVDKYGLTPHLRLGREATGAVWDEHERVWRVTTAGGEVYEARVLMPAVGALHHPNIPEIPGIEAFEGRAFHSARWPDDVDLAGQRVAVVGSAASAVQIVPELAQVASSLTVFQRTPNWIRPRNDLRYAEAFKRAARLVPALGKLHRLQIYGLMEARFPMFLGEGRVQRKERKLCLDHLAAQVPDPELRRALTPDYPPGCKRMLVSDDYYPALCQPHVHLETHGIEQVVAHGVRTVDGRVHEVDAIVWATGFQVAADLTRFPIAGRGGRTLEEAWHRIVAAHRSLTVPGFPNLFLLFGPNSGLGHSSIIFMVERQVEYVMQCLEALGADPMATIEPTEQAFEEHNAELQRAMARTVWRSGCKSWYQDDHGEIFTLWPHSTLRFWAEMRRMRPEEYQIHR